jgi:hypothetical protein
MPIFLNVLAFGTDQRDFKYCCLLKSYGELKKTLASTLDCSPYNENLGFRSRDQVCLFLMFAGFLFLCFKTNGIDQRLSNVLGPVISTSTGYLV